MKIEKKLMSLLLAVMLLLTTSSCGRNDSDVAEEQNDVNSNDQTVPVTEPDMEIQPAIYKPHDPEPYSYYTFDESDLVEYTGTVHHLFFHQVIAYPELAFDGDANESGYDDWMVTVSEFNKILDSLYEKGYILVNWNDVWTEYTTDSGVQRMQKNTLMIPEGRIPLVLSFDDINYYEDYSVNGCLEKLIIGDDGEIWAYGHDPQGNEVITQDLDAVTILDKFIREHPDFSLNGAKGCLCLTGYEGILGYRTNTDSVMTANGTWTDEMEANRQSEIEAVKPIVQRLKDTGWYFGSHTWGHIRLESHSLDAIKRDTQRWFDEVGSLVGETKLLIYPHGSRPDGNDWTQTGECFKYLQSVGFRVFASVGVENFSYIKQDICAVILDRMHPDGTTLRSERTRYLPYFDTLEVFDYEWRPSGTRTDNGEPYTMPS